MENIKVLITEEEIKRRVCELGAEITKDYAGKSILLIGVLKGAAVFMSDLMRCIDLPVEIDFMVVSSYGSGTKTSGNIKILKDTDVSVEGRDVIIAEDILDTGITLNNLKDLLLKRGAKSLKICTIFNKPARRKSPIEAEYVGFDVPDEFVIGYGLDYDQKYRNLPYLGVLDSSVYGDQ
ncbi:MAG: hypoxanthine phosphoribosyltransferase [Clostridia bacterium]|nr:hypoxanthine phosphoribosyltransferase [Clostridia bacterium]